MTAKLRLIASDLDNTILDPDGMHLRPGARRAVERAGEDGVLFVPATGRSPQLTPDFNFPPFRYGIYANGALVLDRQDGRVLWSETIEAGRAAAAIEALDGYEGVMELFIGSQVLVERRVWDRFPAWNAPACHIELLQMRPPVVVNSFTEYLRRTGQGVHKINFIRLPAQYRAGFRRALEDVGGLQLPGSYRGAFEVTAQGVTKGRALRALCDRLGIPPEAVAAFGDDDNDMDMLLFAGCGVAMGGGDAQLKAAARYVTDPADPDGIGRFLAERFGY